MTFTKSDEKEFNTIRNSLLRVIAMMMGELDYEGFRESVIPLQPDMERVAIIIFVVFCVTVSLVVNNLLIGLAVGDIESVQKNAEIKLLSLQVTQIQEFRKKLFFPGLLRRCYVKTHIEMPNGRDCKAEMALKQTRESKIRKTYEKGLKNLSFSSDAGAMT
ncbi:transient receptor potential cation channel subfamily A member 1-like [Xenia sp. Carnegie-2017]|uniref:transient receptor potential cation channel subfamily A member 1-like n=1 Tax=Xenia sp. Carnegie-2017 TaxID=2897299 RepID=UPI001F04D922|nr:transient receptor potential cation channel subfamily A member 1-like [Xenia sp. Carnegie-2017]